MPAAAPMLFRARSRSGDAAALGGGGSGGGSGGGAFPPPEALTRQRSGSDPAAGAGRTSLRPATAAAPGVAERGGRVRHRAAQAVAVFCRWRPLGARERAGGAVEYAATFSGEGEGAVRVVDPALNVAHDFAFNGCFQPGASQHEVFEAVGAPLVGRIMSEPACWWGV